MPRRKIPKIVLSDEDSDKDDKLEEIKPIPRTRRSTRQSTRQLSQKQIPNEKKSNSTETKLENVTTNTPTVKKPVKSQKNEKEAESSSSESDIENYLQPIDKIDLDNAFFDVNKKENTNVGQHEAAIQRLSDSSDSDCPSPPKKLALDTKTDDNVNKYSESTSNETTASFQQFMDYTKQMADTKQQIEEITAKKIANTLNETDIFKMLKAGESSIGEENKAQLMAELHSSDFESCDSEKEDWEEVLNKTKVKSKKKPDLVPKQNIEITIEGMPSVVKKKKGDDVFMAMKRRFNRIKKENQVHMHKVHVLAWIAHGNYVSSVINGDDILAMALSLLPSDKCYPPKRTDLAYLELIVGWFSKTIVNVDKEITSNLPLGLLLKQQLQKKEVYNSRMLVFVFIAVLRALGIQSRLVLSFQVLPLRPPARELCSLSTKNEKNKNENEQEIKADLKDEKEKEKAGTSKTEKAKKGRDENIKSKKGASQNDDKNTSKTQKEESKPRSSRRSTRTKNDKETKSQEIESTGKRSSRNVDKNKSSSESSRVTRSTASSKSPAKKVNLSVLKTSSPPKPTSSPDLKKSKYFGAGTSKNSLDVRNDIMSLLTNRINNVKDEDKRRLRKSGKSCKNMSEDKDYVPVAIKPKEHDSDDDFVPKIKVKRRVNPKGEEDSNKKRKKTFDVWVEVYLENEEEWISVDVNKAQVHCLKEIYTRASHPISYIVAWNNSNALKDITRRYCENYNTITRKLRAEPVWFEASIAPFQGEVTAQDRQEDGELDQRHIDQPLPKIIAEYKNHPLYVLKRHLLKFEALYPPTCVSIGFVRNEEVYSRQCVYTLHSREIWLKHAKVVKPGEKPYKIVKARPKYDKLSNKMITDQLLEVFGPWQTMDYDPPTAENGRVPRNAYGNVELFKACMLPKKTVHLKLPGLNKVARKLNIDCASAVTGFDFHGGWNHAVYDGYVVCEEFKQVLIDAWEQEQEEIEKREQEKLDKRVYGNWKKLIKGLLIRERLQKRYDFGGEASKSDSTTSNAPKKANSNKKGARFQTKKRRIESGSESE